MNQKNFKRLNLDNDLSEIKSRKQNYDDDDYDLSFLSLNRKKYREKKDLPLYQKKIIDICSKCHLRATKRKALSFEFSNYILHFDDEEILGKSIYQKMLGLKVIYL